MYVPYPYAARIKQQRNFIDDFNKRINENRNKKAITEKESSFNVPNFENEIKLKETYHNRIIYNEICDESFFRLGYMPNEIYTNAIPLIEKYRNKNPNLYDTRYESLDLFMQEPSDIYILEGYLRIKTLFGKHYFTNPTLVEHAFNCIFDCKDIKLKDERDKISTLISKLFVNIFITKIDGNKTLNDDYFNEKQHLIKVIHDYSYPINYDRLVELYIAKINYKLLINVKIFNTTLIDVKEEHIIYAMSKIVNFCKNNPTEYAQLKYLKNHLISNEEIDKYFNNLTNKLK